MIRPASSRWCMGLGLDGLPEGRCCLSIPTARRDRDGSPPPFFRMVRQKPTGCAPRGRESTCCASRKAGFRQSRGCAVRHRPQPRGSVALYALLRGSLAKRIRGVVCLSTPFISVRDRLFRTLLWMPTTMAICIGVTLALVTAWAIMLVQTSGDRPSILIPLERYPLVRSVLCALDPVGHPRIRMRASLQDQVNRRIPSA